MRDFSGTVQKKMKPDIEKQFEAKLAAYNVREAETRMDIVGNPIAIMGPRKLWDCENPMGFFLDLLERPLGDCIKTIVDCHKNDYGDAVEYARDHVVPCLEKLIPNTAFDPEIYALFDELFKEAAQGTNWEKIGKIANALLVHERVWYNFRFVAKMTLYAHM